MKRELRSILLRCIREIKKLPEEHKNEKEIVLVEMKGIFEIVKQGESRLRNNFLRYKNKLKLISKYVASCSPKEKKSIDDFKDKYKAGEKILVKQDTAVWGYLCVKNQRFFMNTNPNSKSVVIQKGVKNMGRHDYPYLKIVKENLHDLGL